MRILPRVFAAVVACSSVVGCVTEETPINAPIATDEIEGAVSPPITCPGTSGNWVDSACSGAGGNVYSSLYRAGRSATEKGEVGQIFKLSAGQGGYAGRVRLKMRLLKDLPVGGAASVVVVEVREVTTPGVIPTSSAATFARGTVLANTLPRGKPADVDVILTQVGGPTRLVDTKTYAFVVSTNDGDATPDVYNLPTPLYVGVSSHKGASPYQSAQATLKAYRRGMKATVADTFRDDPFLDYGTDDDISFSVSLGDGGAPDACWSTLMVWGTSNWGDNSGGLCIPG